MTHLKNKMKFDIVCQTKLHNCVTLAGLAREVKGFSGDQLFSIKKSDTIFWDKISDMAIDSICELCADGIITVDVSEYDGSFYLWDGGEPIMKRFLKENIQWMPLMFKLGCKIQFTPDQCKGIKQLILHEQLNNEGNWNVPLTVLELERTVIARIDEISTKLTRSTAQRKFKEYIKKIGLLEF